MRLYWSLRQRFLERLFGSHIRHMEEYTKLPRRCDLVNFLLQYTASKKSVDISSLTYLEIGVRNVSDNFNHILPCVKFAVDPAVRFEFSLGYTTTSDEFFTTVAPQQKSQFDVIFIDGLHTADQVDRDIRNSLDYLAPDGFIVLHDCNPLSEWHARENQSFLLTPATGIWNGTTWKAFVKWRMSSQISSCCIDSDWGLGIISRSENLGEPLSEFSEFYDFDQLNQNRNQVLNLMSYRDFQGRLKSAGLTH
jgi:hypothetical protein